MEIAEKRHASEREASEMYQRTLAQSDELMARAEALLSDAGTRAREITTQAESTLKQAEMQAENLSETSNRNAFHLINEARRRSELLTRKAEGYALNAISDAEERARRLQDEYEDINEFLDSLKSLMSTEAVVSVVESTALALSAEESKRAGNGTARKTRFESDENTVDAELMEEDEQ
jgi:vacuolar-type H+-ATPase subunit H